ncbi:Oidioi.mRNA.OKI2018_I69.chr1.g2407.t1.cds [Oikopleura dioica]|uniref:Oidioi.mRNA.OKI2018_I69.chr1.g2407.t1.cds n=1 Tax=Oikopleura dioica TaxID=34765 RepID=A0ABN7SV97_OIKDI|nr:Oidioi.mRNA.OKI2018_I69.chr1.g2407.t1.cds [Oikopleura dioica]
MLKREKLVPMTIDLKNITIILDEIYLSETVRKAEDSVYWFIEHYEWIVVGCVVYMIMYMVVVLLACSKKFRQDQIRKRSDRLSRRILTLWNNRMMESPCISSESISGTKEV